MCDLYQQAPALHEQGEHLLSTDEKPGIQAVERDHPTHPAEPGGVQSKERREYNDDRHGTLCVIANFEVPPARWSVRPGGDPCATPTIRAPASVWTDLC